MPKYSTGNSDNTEDNSSCTLCDEADGPIKTVNVAGASVSACKKCRENVNHGVNNKKKKKKRRGSKPNTSKTINKTGGYTITNPDSSWVDRSRPDYGNVQTPYLRKEYSKILKDARSELGLTVEELSEKSGVEKKSIKSLESGSAVSDNVSKDEVVSIEDTLEIKLQE